jgi:D-aminopeptidase
MTRARDLGIPFDGHPGPWNAITDVPGIEVGYVTLIQGDAVRTGVTAILPRGKESADPVFAGWFPLNGNGEMTGTTWIEESGFLEGPILLTNTHSVGVVRDAVVAWQVKHGKLFQSWSYPLVAETYDGYLNDINGFHVKAEHAHAALDSTRSGPVAEGNVGGGTGMICYEFKGGTGTASRQLPDSAGGYMVGVMVQANFGLRHQLLVAGVPVGKAITTHAPFTNGLDRYNDRGSIIIIVATNAPLLPHQLKRVARRAGLGLARTGGVAANSSGDIFLAFSTANPAVAKPSTQVAHADFVPNDQITPLFEATLLATEEAIFNALVAAETMTGLAGHVIHALPHTELQTVLKYNLRNPKGLREADP